MGTDAGEIQNALPRWGTIHWTGYPLYTFLGSLFSAVRGAVAVGLMAALLQELGAAGPLAALGALVAAVSAFWMDASLVEDGSFVNSQWLSLPVPGR